MGISRNVLVLGIGSFLTDISSEMIYPVLPLFLANVLGAPKSVIGLIEGIAESTASLLKVFSGWLSDRLGRKKPLIIFGYTSSNLIKPLLAVTTSWPQVLGIRFLDRVGKGVRTSPRDALIADSTEKKSRGKAFGFHRALDTLGAALGPLSAFLILFLFSNNVRMVFLLSALPGVLAVIVFLFFLREKKSSSFKDVSLPHLSFKSLSKEFKLFVFIATIFALGNSSDAFLILRAENLGLSVALIPFAYFFFNLIYSTLSMPAGVLSDKIGRRKVVLLGYFLFAFLYLCFALANRTFHVWILFTLYGIYYALTEGVQRAFVGDLVPSGLRGMAMGTFNALTGFALLPASVIGGTLWQLLGPSATFYYGALLAFISGLLLYFFRIE